jgi:glycosyltransferase involved in cell wall biosynthesis
MSSDALESGATVPSEVTPPDHETTEPVRSAGSSLVMPRVSVVIPSIGRATLAQAVASALTQDPPPEEVVVIFDLECPADDHGLPPEVRILCTGGGCGPSATRNLGIAQAQGDAIALLDDDDYWYPGKLAAQNPVLAAARERHELAVVTTAYDLVTHDGEAFRQGPDALIQPGQRVAEYLFKKRRIRGGGTGFPTGCLLIERDLLLRYPFDPTVPIHEDWDWFLRIEHDAHASFIAVPDRYFAYRMPPDGGHISSSSLWPNSVRWAEDRRSLLSKREYGDFLLCSPTALAIDAGDRSSALKIALRGLVRGRPGIPAIVFAAGLLVLPRQGTRRIWPLVDRFLSYRP